jgi:hypothetical protein
MVLLLMATGASLSCHKEGVDTSAAVEPATGADEVLAFCRFYFGEDDAFRPEAYVVIINLSGRQVTLNEPRFSWSRRYYLLDEIPLGLAQAHNRDVEARRENATFPRPFHRWSGLGAAPIWGFKRMHGSLVLQPGESAVFRWSLPEDHTYGKRTPDEVGLDVHYDWRAENGPLQRRMSTFYLKPPGLGGFGGKAVTY